MTKDAHEDGNALPRDSHGGLTRRSAILAAVSGGASIAAIVPAAAQRCPMPPETPKGPAVYLDLDQTEIDEAYDNDLWAFNVKSIDERRKANNAIAQAVLGKLLRLAYGDAEIEKL